MREKKQRNKNKQMKPKTNKTNIYEKQTTQFVGNGI